MGCGASAPKTEGGSGGGAVNTLNAVSDAVNAISDAVNAANEPAATPGGGDGGAATSSTTPAADAPAAPEVKADKSPDGDAADKDPNQDATPSDPPAAAPDTPAPEGEGGEGGGGEAGVGDGEGGGGGSAPAGAGAPGASSIRGHRKDRADKVKHNPGACRTEPRKIDWSSADPDKWEFIEKRFNGGYSFSKEPEFEEVEGAIEDGLNRVKEDATRYLGLYYQSNMVEWGVEQQKYKLVLRTKSGFSVTEEADGPFTFVLSKYKALEPVESIAEDGVTDTLQYKGVQLPPPVLPGRGQGCADVPMIKIMGDVDPSDVAQGSVGDCWLLSAISALGEFDGAIKELFRKTEGIDTMPFDTPNSYTVTLYDLATWEPRDITIDERLCMKADGSGLLGCAPTVTGELWTCYLEKACAVHAGGWDNIDGGQCTHGWALLTGYKHQYTFMNRDGAGFCCYGKFNPNTKEWEALTNSPKTGFRGIWPMEWPEVGGGGELNHRVDNNEMFERMCAWDDAGFMMGCGTKAGDDTQDTDGIVDGHAYTILDVVDNAGGTEFDLIKVRNPWGKGEFKSGIWDDDGPGWVDHPEVKEALKPVVANDGVFWVDKDEFFQYFATVYLCALDMTVFCRQNEAM